MGSAASMGGCWRPEGAWGADAAEVGAAGVAGLSRTGQIRTVTWLAQVTVWACRAMVKASLVNFPFGAAGARTLVLASILA